MANAGAFDNPGNIRSLTPNLFYPVKQIIIGNKNASDTYATTIAVSTIGRFSIGATIQ